MKQLFSWLRKPFDRCRAGNHIMFTRSGYILCRKHGEIERFKEASK